MAKKKKKKKKNTKQPIQNQGKVKKKRRLSVADYVFIAMAALMLFSVLIPLLQ